MTETYKALNGCEAGSGLDAANDPNWNGADFSAGRDKSISIEEFIRAELTAALRPSINAIISGQY